MNSNPNENSVSLEVAEKLYTNIRVISSSAFSNQPSAGSDNRGQGNIFSKGVSNASNLKSIKNLSTSNNRKLSDSRSSNYEKSDDKNNPNDKNKVGHNKKYNEESNADNSNLTEPLNKEFNEKPVCNLENISGLDKSNNKEESKDKQSNEFAISNNSTRNESINCNLLNNEKNSFKLNNSSDYKDCKSKLQSDRNLTSSEQACTYENSIGNKWFQLRLLNSPTNCQTVSNRGSEIDTDKNMKLYSNNSLKAKTMIDFEPSTQNTLNPFSLYVDSEAKKFSEESKLIKSKSFLDNLMDQSFNESELWKNYKQSNSEPKRFPFISEENQNANIIYSQNQIVISMDKSFLNLSTLRNGGSFHNTFYIQSFDNIQIAKSFNFIETNQNEIPLYMNYNFFTIKIIPYFNMNFEDNFSLQEIRIINDPRTRYIKLIQDKTVLSQSNLSLTFSSLTRNEYYGCMFLKWGNPPDSSNIIIFLFTQNEIYCPYFIVENIYSLINNKEINENLYKYFSFLDTNSEFEIKESHAIIDIKNGCMSYNLFSSNILELLIKKLFLNESSLYLNFSQQQKIYDIELIVPVNQRNGFQEIQANTLVNHELLLSINFSIISFNYQKGLENTKFFSYTMLDNEINNTFLETSKIHFIKSKDIPKLSNDISPFYNLDSHGCPNEERKRLGYLNLSRTNEIMIQNAHLIIDSRDDIMEGSFETNHLTQNDKEEKIAGTNINEDNQHEERKNLDVRNQIANPPLFPNFDIEFSKNIDFADLKLKYFLDYPSISDIDVIGPGSYYVNIRENWALQYIPPNTLMTHYCRKRNLKINTFEIHYYYKMEFEMEDVMEFIKTLDYNSIKSKLATCRKSCIFSKSLPYKWYFTKEVNTFPFHIFDSYYQPSNDPRNIPPNRRFFISDFGGINYFRDKNIKTFYSKILFFIHGKNALFNTMTFTLLENSFFKNFKLQLGNKNYSNFKEVKHYFYNFFLIYFKKK